MNLHTAKLLMPVEQTHGLSQARLFYLPRWLYEGYASRVFMRT